MSTVKVIGSVGYVKLSKNLLKVLLSSRSQETGRYTLAGIQIKRVNDVVTLTTTDTFQITIVRIESEGPDFEVVLTHREFMNRVVDKGTNIREAQIDLINLLDDERFNVEGKYPKWENILPDNCEKKAIEFSSYGVNTHEGFYNLKFLDAIQELMEETQIVGKLKENHCEDPVRFEGENFTYVISPINPKD